MEVFKIEITSWTSSFRYPNLISGFQPTLEVPPLSTILGLINAAAGYYVEFQNLEIGYYFKFESKAIDLETIYQIQSDKGRPTNNAKSNIIKREFLFDNYLAIYLTDEKLINFFKKPYYPLVLGRMNDLATITNIKKIELEKIELAEKIKGQIIPFRGNYLQGQIQALPKYFSNTIPRQNLGTKPYSIINWNVNDFQTNIKAYRDITIDKKGVDIYFHKLEID
ncbi:MAG: type I-B CRISPR-associated protein Cas5 [Bacteroidetes bacterium CG02_land_8_20_14_3_00_31_25]|nr:MAG: type I-B CRISPR-associated protein Cas5 [Bacteroidetes bacterium CG02_land_8_20_14_3_00_31_25]PIX35955.1 MAG: type I-B CRISPR-associated protein Cas5 [Bacteroidetes bacterium CG_4_8_14_3_um_filter_31_14]PIY02812.1 MAG: type I-B CRISPR-associated protein Cas5 [Bacteroidetes bacterium CG_4_10_14_3_um_filter_31_20]